MDPTIVAAPPAGFWSLEADLLALVVAVADPVGLPALMLAEQRCRDAARPRLQALAASPLRRPPFYMHSTMILSTEYNLAYVDVGDDDDLGDAEVQTLAAAFAGGHMAHVKGLRLSNKSIGDPGMQALAPALHHLPRLEWLDISNNAIGEAGVAALARAAADGALRRLRVLFLDSSSLSEGEVRALAGGALSALEVFVWKRGSAL
jgi:hypothetical protein